jgi:uncharacterized protein (DUF1330 family)
MPAYLIARVHVTDPERYKEYTTLAPAVIAKYGGRYLVRGGAVTTLEGAPERDRIVVLEFPSHERATAFYASLEYQHAKSKRAGAATGQFIVIDGYAG